MHAMSRLVRSARREKALSFSQSLAGLVQVLPSVLSSGVVAGMMHGVDVTLTNVPGLTEPHYLAGAAVDRIYAFAPTAGAALNVGLVSHLGTACIGTLSDAAAVSDPARLQRLIAASFEELIVAAEARPAAPPPTPPAPGPSSTAPERLSALDTGFLRLETAETPMHLGAAFLLDGDPLRDDDGTIRVGDIRRHVEARLRRVTRFTRRIAEVPFGVGRPLWVDDEDFDIQRHVRLTTVAEPGDLQTLLDRCAELFRDPLDRTHPLWELWLVDGLAAGGIGIVAKLHHALVDGLGGVEFAAAVFDVESIAPPEAPVRTRPVPGPSASRRLADALAWQLADPVRVVSRTMSSLARSPDRVAEQVGNAVAAALELARRGSRAPDAGFNRAVGRERVLRAIGFELGEVHRIREPIGATVNDVVLATVTGGMRKWLLSEGEPPVDLHVLVPVSVRDDSINAQRGNHVGGVMVALPVGEPDPLRRLEIVQTRMRRLKAAHEGEGAATVLDAFDHVPAIGDRAVTRLVAAQPFVNFVVTNVPGSPVPLHLLGARVEAIVPVVPLGPGLGLGIAILTYADRLTISISADPELCPDVDALAAAIAAELPALASAFAASVAVA
jgi:WS/DGAT/MGAT family acyltransferase